MFNNKTDTLLNSDHVEVKVVAAEPISEPTATQLADTRYSLTEQLNQQTAV